MPFNRKEPSDGEIRRWFLEAPAVPKGTFEFALVLGGTVSAGAYTAGAVDFLIEALDCLAAAQQQNEVPHHTVLLKLIAGTSGGGVNAAIAARALAFDYPRVTRGTRLVSGQPSGNPFYDIWVNTLRLERFLDPSDVSGQVRSALNGAAIDDGAAQIIHFAPNPPKARPWVAAPLRAILTLTSLRGVPYSTDLGSGLSQTYVDHADYVRFAFVYPGQQLGDPRPDEQVLAFGAERLLQATSWEEFSQFARATAAFPLGFPARALTRPTNHYRYRVVPYPTGVAGAETYKVRRPDWDAMASPEGDVPEDWHYLCVDGGATDNEPIELARTSLAGLLGRNPRDAATANRAVWLIDPFAGRTALGPQVPTTFLNDSAAIATTLTQQTRYDSADILMAADPNVFSRFMLSPTRGDITGEEAIASGGVGAFIGFACPAFMRFDYLLGRANCPQFLRGLFNLSDTNPLFMNWADPKFKDWVDRQRELVRRYAPAGQGENKLPIIPLVGDAAVDEALDPWPKGKLDPERYRDAIEARFRAIFELELSGDFAKAALGWIGAHATQRYVADVLINAMKAYLAKADLA
jgi:hypothetical protein